MMAVPEKYRHIDFKPPKAVAEAAEKGLEFRRKANPSDKGGLSSGEAGKLGIGSGVQRATNLKNRDECSPDVIQQMCAFFSRHEKNKGIAPENRQTPWKDKGYVAWQLWGGDAGRTWAEKVRDQMDRADEKAGKTAMLHRVAITPEKRKELDWEYQQEQRQTRRFNQVLEQLAEVAAFSHDVKGADFLRQMARARYAPTEKQQAYIDALKAKYEKKLPLLDKMRADATQEIEKAQRAKEEADRLKEQEEKELAALGREMRREGWAHDKSWGSYGYTLEEPPYRAHISPDFNQYDSIEGWRGTVQKDGREIFRKDYNAKYSPASKLAELLEELKDTVVGVIEKDKRRSVVPVEATPPMKSPDLKERLTALQAAAAAAHNTWMTDFAASLLKQVMMGRTLTDKQKAYMEKGFAQYRIASRQVYSYDRRLTANHYKEAGIHNINALSAEQRKVLKELGAACQAAVKAVEGLFISVSGSVTDTWQKGKEYKRDAFGRMSPMAGKPHALLSLSLEARDNKGSRVAETDLELLLSQDGTMALTKNDKYGFRGHRLVDGKEIGKEFGETFNAQVQRIADAAQRQKEREQDREQARLEEEAEAARLAPKITGLKERPDLNRSRGTSTNPNSYREPTYFEIEGENLSSNQKAFVVKWLNANGHELGVHHLGYGAKEEGELQWIPSEKKWFYVSYYSYTGD